MGNLSIGYLAHDRTAVEAYGLKYSSLAGTLAWVCLARPKAALATLCTHWLLSLFLRTSTILFPVPRRCRDYASLWLRNGVEGQLIRLFFFLFFSSSYMQPVGLWHANTTWQSSEHCTTHNTSSMAHHPYTNYGTRSSHSSNRAYPRPFVQAFIAPLAKSTHQSQTHPRQKNGKNLPCIHLKLKSFIGTRALGTKSTWG